MREKISVIIPVYKVEKYLRQCLDSIVNQTYRDLEIILIDDGSPDRCGDICNEYAAQDDRIVVIHKENGGLSAARNDGIQIATSPWIAFVDSDDWCELDYYEQFARNMERYDEVDVICVSDHYIEFEDHTERTASYTQEFFYNTPSKMEYLMKRVLSACVGEGRGASSPFGYPWDRIYRKEFLNQNRLYFDQTLKVCEDSLFNYQVFSYAKAVCGFICCGYHYRYVAASITKQYSPQRAVNNYAYISKLYQHTERINKTDQLVEVLNIHALGTIKQNLMMCYFHSNHGGNLKEVAKNVHDMKSWPYYRQVIFSKSNQYLSKNQVMFKMLLRIPFVWPLREACKIHARQEKR